MSKTKPFRPYGLVRPCARCPFRTDVEPYLREDRAAGIATSILGGGEFHCHETTVEDPDDESEMTSDENSKVCAGSLVIMAKSGEWNQMARVGMRLGYLDPDRLDLEAPVPDSFAEWQRRFRPDDAEDVEPCNVVGPACEAPAGYAIGGGIVEGTESAPYECWECGTPVCGACSTLTNQSGDDVRICIGCEEALNG